MSDSDTSLNMPADELALLKQRADMLGITYSPKIGVDSLREKIGRKLAEPAGNADGAAEEDVSAATPVVKGPNPESEAGLSEGQRKARIRRRMREEEMRLVRIRVNCLNPNKNALQGEILTVANKHLGIVKKFIPYGEASEEGYHVPHVLYKQLKARKFLDIKTRKDKRTGKTIITQRWVPEFAIEVLPMLTQKELDQLAAAQAAAGGLD